MEDSDNGFEHFCGSELWNNNVTWWTSQPDLTICFRNTILRWVGTLWLLLTAVPYVWHLRRQKTVFNETSRLTRLKLVLTLMLGIIAIVDVIDLATKTKNEDFYSASIVAPIIEILTFIYVFFLIKVEFKKGVITSGILFLFWTIQLVCAILRLYSFIIQANIIGYVKHVDEFVIFCLNFLLIFLAFIICCFVDAATSSMINGRKESPEIRASFLSLITFSWLNELIVTGFKKTLTDADIYNLNPKDASLDIIPIFEQEWYTKMKSHKMKSNLTQAIGMSELEEDQRPLLDSKSNGSKNYKRSSGAVNGGLKSGATDNASKHEYGSLNNKSKKSDAASSEGKRGGGPGGSGGGGGGPFAKSIYDKKMDRPSLWAVLVKIFGSEMLFSWSFKIFYDGLQFLNPSLLKYLIAFTEDSSVPVWKGYFYAFIFFLSSVICSFFYHQCWHRGIAIGMRAKSVLIAAIYKKALLLNNGAKKHSTVGAIVNLMSVDAQRIQDVSGFLWMIWSAPLQIIIALVLLWVEMGASVLAGLAVMILLVPFNAFIANKQRSMQIQQMRNKDERIKLMNEMLNGIKVLKLYAWEESFQKKIVDIRERELKILKKVGYLNAATMFSFICAPFIVTLATFAAYILASPDNRLTSAKAFTTLALFNILKLPLALLPMAISFVVTATVSINRIGNYLADDELPTDGYQIDDYSPDAVRIERANFLWEKNQDQATLSNIELKVRPGSLVAIVGQVGSGKSSLVQAMLGEMERVGGRVVLKGNVAYASQQAWIQNATLKDNILFGMPFDEARYQQVIEDCALGPDLRILPGGDKTEIGEKGINLSGGQKQRVSLARAVYANSDIVILDDPLSAVDSHVGKHIFEKVIGPKGCLAGKTRIFVTNGIQWLPHTDHIYVMMNGEISEEGHYSELLMRNGPFAQFLKEFLDEREDEIELNSDDEEGAIPEDSEISAQLDEIQMVVQKLTSEDEQRSTSRSASRNLSEIDTARSETPSTIGRRKLSRRMSSRVVDLKFVEAEKKRLEEKERLTKDETSETGNVKLSVFITYIKSLKLVYTAMFLTCFLLYQTAAIFSNFWINMWTEDKFLNDPSVLSNSTEYKNKQDMYLGVYGGIGSIQAFFVLCFSVVFAVSFVESARSLHFAMLVNILRCPMSFFDTTPIGRIVNRFSRDVETIDQIIPQAIRAFLNTGFTVISTMIVISITTPLFIIVLIPLIISYWAIQRCFIPTTRQLKRIESTTRSPIYTHFSESVSGASTLRAYRVVEKFKNISQNQVENNNIFYIYGMAANRWLGFRLEFIGAIIVFCAALFAVIGREISLASIGSVGLSVSYALQVTGALNMMVRTSTDLETNIVSVERLKEYTTAVTEAAWNIPQTAPPASWPDKGELTFKSYSVRYREDLDLVLRKIDARIAGGEKIGVVGRTGAGKSSLTLCLFRIIEAADGSIVLDGQDISSLGLHQLRKQITILPQDPVIFSGTLRMNLDPFDQYSDEQIWRALENSHMRTFVSDLKDGLDHQCGEGGNNLSVGQRQLLCLARTLLRKTKILILDEATAAVDLETDALIQATIRREFASCTIITIAHRLNTIMDNDRVMVLDQGRILEFNSPKLLLQNDKSAFYSMAKDANLV